MILDQEVPHGNVFADHAFDILHRPLIHPGAFLAVKRRPQLRMRKWTTATAFYC
ncbi:MAG: hypothetical protein K2Y51_17690 [Gammaproteobacteria bacterium]|jgi:hypothetical protein|nr:hypothetical protein [Gammaproteobacteria bacterium]